MVRALEMTAEGDVKRRRSAPAAPRRRPAKVTGAARYAAEFNQPDQVYAVVVTSSIGRGRIIAIEGDALGGAPGVVAVLTHHNAPRLSYGANRSYVDPETGERLHVLQDAEIRFFGHPSQSSLRRRSRMRSTPPRG